MIGEGFVRGFLDAQLAVNAAARRERWRAYWSRRWVIAVEVRGRGVEWREITADSARAAARKAAGFFLWKRRVYGVRPAPVKSDIRNFE